MYRPRNTRLRATTSLARALHPIRLKEGLP